jgi:2-(1,2-epoxy-1,2-dihydrophenyl)acetyl-CoA isomerase
MAHETIIEERRPNGVVKITLNRPEKLNAVNARMHAELREVFERVRLDRDARCVVITGAGRAFCAGADVGGMAERGDERDAAGIDAIDLEGNRLRLRDSGHAMMRALRAVEVPTIASVNGVCVGAGFDLACTVDLCIGSTAARYMVAYVRRGLFADLGGFWAIPKQIGMRKAIEMMTTGDFLSAEEAHRLGLTNALVAPDELEAATDALANRIAAGPPIAQKLGKMLAYKTANLDFDTALDWSASAIGIASTSHDHRESVKAFFEKRDPTFTGR